MRAASAHELLDGEMALVQPKVIVALGSEYLMGAEARITRDRGRWLETKYGVPAIATYHPAYLLRLTGQDIVGEVGGFYDLKAAVERCCELAPDWEPAAGTQRPARLSSPHFC